jgi:DNA-binding MarR family transcriptional regulator
MAGVRSPDAAHHEAAEGATIDKRLSIRNSGLPMRTVSEFERVARLIVECHRELSTAGDRLLADHGLTRARLQILSALSAGPRTLADLARDTSVTRQAVQQVATGLRDEALVSSAPNPRDRRAPLHELTDLGHQRLEKADADHAAWLEEQERQIPDEVLVGLCLGLEHLLDKIRSRP